VSGVCMILSLVVWSRKNVSNNIYIIIASSIPVPTRCATVLVNSLGNAYTIMDVIMSVLTSRVASVVVVASSEPSGEVCGAAKQKWIPLKRYLYNLWQRMASTSRRDGTLLSQNCTNNTRFKRFTALAGSPTSWHFKDEDWRVAAAERACNSRVLTLWCFLQCETQDLATIKAIIHCSPPQEKKKNAGKKKGEGKPTIKKIEHKFHKIPIINNIY